MFHNTFSGSNTAVGVQALFNNTLGNGNVATGFDALFHNTTGSGNTASGGDALNFNTTGSDNTATGVGALFANTIGNDNTVEGVQALGSNGAGSGNTAIGAHALRFSTGNNNIALGENAGGKIASGSNNIDIGNEGRQPDSGIIRIGTIGTHTNTFIAGISGVTVADGVAVIVNANGRLGTITSSERYKNEIKPMDKVSEAILGLEPVSFRYKEELDPAGIPQFGLVAEQVEKVAPDLVARDEEGKAYTVRYEAVNAMLLNEFLKEHRKVEEQAAKLAQYEAQAAKQDDRIAQQQKQIEALTAGLQKVSAEIEVKRSAMQMAPADE